MPTYYGAINLSKNELQNAVIQNLPSAPASPAKGQIYMDSTTNTLYWWDGTKWVSAAGGTAAFPGYGSVLGETTFGLARADGVAVTVARSDHTHGSPAHSAAEHSSIPISALAPPTADVNFGGFKLTNVATPVNPTDAANKSYVDNSIAGLSWKDAVRLTPGPSTNFGVMSGLNPIDGVTPVDGDRILLTGQSTASSNGIWIAHAGAWTRATDVDAPNEIDGMAVFVTEGTTYADTAWVLTTNAPITIGTTPLAYTQFSGASAATAGAGLTATGNVFNVGAGTGIVVAADSVSVDATYLDGQYVNVAGDTMTGALTINAGAGVAGLVTNGRINVNGGVFPSASTVKDIDVQGHAIIEQGLEITGAYDVLLSRDPTTNLQATTKQYVDNKVAGSVPVTRSITAGTGLTGGGPLSADVTINAVAGDTTLTVAADSIVVNTAVIATVASLAAYAKKFAAALTGTIAYATGEVVTHNLNTRDIANVQVVNGASPYQAVVVDWEATSLNTVTVRYNPNLGAGYRVVVTG